jgi:septal ring factor EnvC (AmiA/AmiB activator)
VLLAAGFGLVLALAGPTGAQTEGETPAAETTPSEPAAQPAAEPALPDTQAPATAAEAAASDPAAPGEAADPEAAASEDGAETSTADDAMVALDEIERSISLTAERTEELRAEIAALEGDREQQNAALIAAAQRVKLAEIEIGDVEARLDDLIVDELSVRGRLDGADGEIANVLAALARISRNPPPALIVDPSDALGSARGALLISAILPQLQSKAGDVRADLTRLNEIKAEVLEEEELLRANFEVLEEEQLRIATLISARRQGLGIMTTQLAAEEEEAIALAARATSLKELIDTLGQRASAVTDPVEAVDPDEPLALSAEAIAVALADTARTEPAVPFDLARGHLVLPANGVNVLDYGANDGLGGISQGVSIVTRAEAQVLAPADGWVLYTGPYLNYGQIIIINTGQSYTALLAGLDTISVDIGQFVLMGEPVGTMGSRTIGRTVTTNAGSSQPTLYIELRRDNEPIDPTGWWAPEAQTT